MKKIFPVPGFFPWFFEKIPGFFQNFRNFFGPQKVPIEKSFRGVFNWKNSKFLPQIDSKPSCWAKVDLGQKTGFGVFDFFDAQPVVPGADFGAKSTGSTICIHTASILFRQAQTRALEPIFRRYFWVNSLLLIKSTS